MEKPHSIIIVKLILIKACHALNVLNRYTNIYEIIIVKIIVKARLLKTSP